MCDELLQSIGVNAVGVTFALSLPPPPRISSKFVPTILLLEANVANELVRLFALVFRMLAYNDGSVVIAVVSLPVVVACAVAVGVADAVFSDGPMPTYVYLVGSISA